MSTRANIVVKDQYKSIQIYKHGDGFPKSKYGVIAGLPAALEFAWPLPRMEASDMAAAIVRVMKERGGGIYIDGTTDGTKTLHGDIEYLYFITPDERAGKWAVEVFTTVWDHTEEPKSIWKGYIGDNYPEVLQLGIGEEKLLDFSYCLDCGRIQGTFPKVQDEIEESSFSGNW